MSAHAFASVNLPISGYGGDVIILEGIVRNRKATESLTIAVSSSAKAVIHNFSNEEILSSLDICLKA